MFKKIILLVVGLSMLHSVFSQVPAPGKYSGKGLLITNSIIHDGNGNVITNGWVKAEKGKITAMGSGTPEASSNSFEIVDAKGKHLYPGFILMNNPLGLAEVDAVRATLDMEETGQDNPNVHTLPAYNTDSDLIPTLRSNGILMAQISPRGGRISGLSSIVQLDAWNWEDAVLVERDGMHLNWPSRFSRSGWWAEPGGAAEKSKEYQNQVTELESLFAEAKMYFAGSKAVSNPKLEGFKGLFTGSARLYVHANHPSEIIHALDFASKMGLKNIVLVSGSQVEEVAGLLKEKNIPVVLNRIHNLPDQNDAPVFQPARVPAALMKAGLLFALDYEGGMEIMGARNLGFLAGAATAYGISQEDALSLITRNPAKILGIDKRCGTIEAGKDASFFLSAGNALDMKTQNISQAWIQGRPVSMESKQTVLYEKFRKMLTDGRF